MVVNNLHMIGLINLVTLYKFWVEM